MKKLLFFLALFPSVSFAGFSTDVLTSSKVVTGEVQLSSASSSVDAVAGTTVTISAGTSIGTGRGGAFLRLAPGGTGANGAPTTVLRGADGKGNTGDRASGDIIIQTAIGSNGGTGSIFIQPADASLNFGVGGQLYLKGGGTGPAGVPSYVTVEGGDNFFLSNTGGVNLETGSNLGFGGSPGTINISTKNFATTNVGGTFSAWKGGSFRGTLNAPTITSTNSISANTITATGQIAQTNPLLGDLDNGSFFIDNNSGDVVGYRSGIRYGFGGAEFGQEYFEMTGASAGHEFDKYVVEVTSDGTRGTLFSIDPRINQTTFGTGLSVGSYINSSSSITATSTITVLNATAPKTNIRTFIQDLPLSGGVGPQVNSDVIWARTSLDGGQVGQFLIVASTDEPKLTAGGAPDTNKTYGGLYLNPLYASIYFGSGNDPFGSSSGGFQFSLSGLSFPNGTVQTSAAPAISPVGATYTDGQMLFGNTSSGGLIISTMSGTANQITVVASTFNVTLSLPQSIDTAATTRFGQMGLGVAGSTSQRLKIAAGTTTQGPINIPPGALKTSGQAAGDIENVTDDLYYTITTGAARKNVVLSDSALTSGGNIPFTTTNGRLSQSTFFTFDGVKKLAISGSSGGGSVSLSAQGKPSSPANGDIWFDVTTIKRLQVQQESITQNFATLESSVTWTSTQTHKNNIDLIGTGKFTTNGAQVGLVISTYSDSGAYNFGTATNTIAISNSSSTITLTSSGTYRIDGMANLRYSAATFAANQFVTINLYRQNNTPGVIANSQTQEELQISVGALTNQFGQYNLQPVFYTTTATNDVISLQGSITATPGAGNFQATEASLVAQRLY